MSGDPLREASDTPTQHWCSVASPPCSLVPKAVRWSVVARRCAQAGRPTPSRRLPTLFTLRAAAPRVLLIIMGKSAKPRSRKSNSTLRPRATVCADAAGIDLGATEHFVAVPPERDPQPVRSFTTDTAALQALADWLLHCQVRTVAMEATGVYWVPIFQLLEGRGERAAEHLVVGPAADAVLVRGA